MKATAAGSPSTSASRSVTVTVTNVNEAGTVTLSSSRPYVGDRIWATLTDPDGGIAGQTWSWSTEESSASSTSGASSTSVVSYYYTVPSSAFGKVLKASVSYSDAHGSGQSADTTSTGTVRRRPCSLSLSGSTSVNYAENGTGSVASYTASASNCGSISWSLSGTDDGDFQLTGSGSSRSLRFRSAPNYESPADDDTDNAYSVTVTATAAGAGAPSASKSVTVTVTDVNEAPTISGASSKSVAENTTTVASYTASDPESDSITWSLSGTDAGDFSISSSGALTFASAPNYESPADANTNNLYVVTVRATDDGSPARTATKSVRVTVTDVNERPRISGSSSKSVAENTTTVATYTASDPESDSITWSLSGTDAGDFSISSSGALTFASAPNYESPADANTNNLYVVTVRATDDGSPARTATKSVRVTVTDVNERPRISGSSSKSVAENTTTVATYTASDPESDSITWSLSGTDAGDFSISSSGALTFASAPNYESPADANTNNLYVVTVRATDDGSPARTATKGVRVTVTNADEAGSISLTTTSPQVGAGDDRLPERPRRRGHRHLLAVAGQQHLPGHLGESRHLLPVHPRQLRRGLRAARHGQLHRRPTAPEKAPRAAPPARSRARAGPASKPVALADTPDSVLAVVSAPNPFNPSTTLHFQLPEAGPVSLIVYNMAGQVVATLLHDHYLEAGLHARVWEGRDDRGRTAASGLYLYRLTTQGQVLLGKLALIR